MVGVSASSRRFGSRFRALANRRRLAVAHRLRQPNPTPAATAAGDGSHTVYFAPTRPDGVAEGNWIQTTPGKGWFAILRLYSPRQSFFDRTWRPTESEPTT